MITSIISFLASIFFITSSCSRLSSSSSKTSFQFKRFLFLCHGENSFSFFEHNFVSPETWFTTSQSIHQLRRRRGRTTYSRVRIILPSFVFTLLLFISLCLSPFYPFLPLWISSRQQFLHQNHHITFTPISLSLSLSLSLCLSSLSIKHSHQTKGTLSNRWHHGFFYRCSLIGRGWMTPKWLYSNPYLLWWWWEEGE